MHTKIFANTKVTTYIAAASHVICDEVLKQSVG